MDVHFKICFCWQNAANPHACHCQYRMYCHLLQPTLATVNIISQRELCEDLSILCMFLMYKYIFRRFVRIYSRTLFPFTALLAVGVESPYILYSNGALKWFNFYIMFIVANNNHDTVSQN